RHAQEHVLSIQDGEDQASPPVEKSSLQDVHREEASERLHHQRWNADPPPSAKPVLGRERRVAVGSTDEVLEIPVRVMKERCAERIDTPVHSDGLVHGVFDETADAAPKKSELVFGVESPTPDPGTPEHVLTRDEIAIGRTIRGDDGLDALSQLG